MKTLIRLLKPAAIILGVVSVAFFIYDYFVLAHLRPRMVSYEVVTPSEENLLYGVIIGLLVILAFYMLSLLRIARHLRSAQNVTFLSVILVVAGVLALLFVFSDYALLNDISKQYRHGLSQPEWSLVYPIMGFQFIIAVVFTYLHMTGFNEEGQVSRVVRDSNIFLIVQYVGVICGGMGLALSGLSFFYPNGWNVDIHTTMSLVIMLFPYVLAVLYWLVTKLQEENRQWTDEKQLQDVGQSAILTLLLSVIMMPVLFFANYNNLGGVVSIVWLPLYLYSVLFLFSLGNLYFTNKL